MGRVAFLFPHGHRRCARSLSRVLVCGLVLGCLLGEPAESKPLPKRPSFTHLDLPTGFLPDTDLAMAQDARGFLWLGTQRGLFRYDGHRMLLFPRIQDPGEPVPRAPGACDGVTDLRVATGGLWIATACGLERLDLESERIQRWWLDDPGARALAIAQDARMSGSWWVGTTDGLRQIDTETSTWDPATRDGWPETVHSKTILTLLQEPETLWVGTTEGLFQSSTEGEGFDPVPFSDPPADLAYHEIEALHRDTRGTLWVTSADGLHRVVTDGGPPRLELEEALPGRCVGEPRQWHYGMATDDRGAFWFSSGGTLVSWQPDDGTVDCYSRYQKDPKGLGGSAGNLFVDRGGTLWVATERTLDRLASAPIRAWNYPFDDSVSDFGWQASWSLGLLGAEGTLWVGTNLGLLEIDLESHVLLRHFMADEPELLRIAGQTTVGGLPDFTILALAQQDDGTVWAGTAEGLARLPPGAYRFESVTVPGEPSSGPRIQSLALVEGLLWVGTGQALHRLSTSDGAWTQIPLGDPRQPDAQLDTRPTSIRELGLDPRGRLWVATDHRGLLTIEPGASLATTPELRSPAGEPATLGRANTFFPEAPSTLWIGTEEGRLDRVDLETFETTSPPWNRELAGRTMRGVVRVGHHLWLLTSRGLSRVDTRSGQVRHLGEREGLSEPDGAFGLVRLDQRLLVMGSALFELTLGEEQTTELPPVRFTGLRLSNQRQVPRVLDPTSPLEQSLESTERIELGPDQTVVTFEFAALGFGRPEDLRYHYRLEGTDQPWLETQGDYPFVTYAALAPGHYRLRARATFEAATPGDGLVETDDSISTREPPAPGDPTREAVLEIVVHPPWWRSRPAYALYLLAGLGALAIGLAGQRRELRREQRLNRRLRRLDSLKDELLANTSHELRTPLFGILGLAEGIRDGTEGPVSPGVRRRLDYIVASGRRLADRVDDILDLASLRRQEVALDLQPVEIVPILRDALELLRPLAAAKQLEIREDSADSLPAVLGDPKRLRQVFRHLLENAIKFSEQGTIDLSVCPDGDRLRVAIRDQGVGVAAEDLETIFNDFEQLQGDAARAQGGTGVGLAIVRRLVELHGGTISADSTLGQGTRVVVALPSTARAPSHPVAPQPSPSATPSPWEPSRAVSVAGTASPDPPSTSDPEPAKSEPVGPRPSTLGAEILVVDDEPINRILVEGFFSRTAYSVTAVPGGAEALALLEERPFDLILLDVMMPGMSGFEVCRRIREQHPMESLPILFLSARTAVEDRVEGLASGGNDYLTKPISRAELLVRVEQALTIAGRHPATGSSVAADNRPGGDG